MILSLVVAVVVPLASASADAGPRMLVLDFRDDGVGAELPRIVRDTLVVHLSQQDGAEVLSADDVRRASDLEATKQAAGCTDQSCLAELAGAVDADLVFFGNVARLGSLTQINISALDVRKGTVRPRESIEVDNLEAVPARVRQSADRLLGRDVVDGAGPPVLAVVGGVGVGVGVVGAVIGGVLQATALASAAGKELGSAEVVAAQQTQSIALPLVVGGAVVAAAGVVLFLVAE